MSTLVDIWGRYPEEKRATFSELLKDGYSRFGSSAPALTSLIFNRDPEIVELAILMSLVPEGVLGVFDQGLDEPNSQLQFIQWGAMPDDIREFYVRTLVECMKSDWDIDRELCLRYELLYTELALSMLGVCSEDDQRRLIDALRLIPKDHSPHAFIRRLKGVLLAGDPVRLDKLLELKPQLAAIVLRIRSGKASSQEEQLVQAFVQFLFKSVGEAGYLEFPKSLLSEMISWVLLDWPEELAQFLDIQFGTMPNLELCMIYSWISGTYGVTNVQRALAKAIVARLNYVFDIVSTPRQYHLIEGIIATFGAKHEPWAGKATNFIREVTS